MNKLEESMIREIAANGMTTTMIDTLDKQLEDVRTSTRKLNYEPEKLEWEDSIDKYDFHLLSSMSDYTEICNDFHLYSDDMTKDRILMKKITIVTITDDEKANAAVLRIKNNELISITIPDRKDIWKTNPEFAKHIMTWCKNHEINSEQCDDSFLSLPFF
jgi:hypothetical protein